MLETILKEHGGELLGSLTEGGAMDASQAEGLIPPALSGIGDALSNGQLDLSSLLSGLSDGSGVQSLLGQLDLGEVAVQAGLDQGQTESGLTRLIPVVLSLLGDKAGGAEGLLSMLGGTGEGSGGALGAITGIAGKLFGK